MKIDIHIATRIKNDFINTGIAEYLKRMNTKGWSVNIFENAKDLKKDHIILDENGEELNSEKLNGIISKGYSGERINFYIGPADGIPKDILKGRKTYSISKLTFTSEITLLILIEQIYRFWATEKGKKYVRH